MKNQDEDRNSWKRNIVNRNISGVHLNFSLKLALKSRL
jgi:hypothetical protein